MVIVETSKIGLEHFSIDNAMINIFTKDKEKYYFVGELNLFANHERQSFHASSDVVFFGLKSTPGSFFLLRWFYEFKLIFLALFLRVFKFERSFLFLSLSPFGHLVLSFIKFAFIKCDIFVVVHSEVVFLFKKKSGLKTRLLRLIMLLAIKLRRSKFKHIVLSDHIDSKKIFPYGNFVNINHPCMFSNVSKLSFLNNGYTDFSDRLISFVYVGMGSKGKGLGDYVYIASSFKNSDYVFSVTGKVIENDFDLSALDFYSYSFVDSTVVDSLLSKADFALFFYGADYDWVASGAILDCVKHRIPVVALNSYFFQSLSGRINIVRCFESVEEIIDFMSDRAKLYEFYSSCDFDAAQSYFSIDAASTRLRKCIL